MDQSKINGGASLLNAYAAADIDVSTFPGFVKIPGLPAIPLLSYSGFTKTIGVAEVVQVRTIGVAPSAIPVIAAGTQYQIKIGNDGLRSIGAQNALRPVGATAPDTLSGNAPYDRQLIYQDIANKINSDASFFMTAYPVITVAYVISVGTALVGDIVTETATGATGIVLSLNAGVTLLTVAVLPGPAWSGLVTGTSVITTITSSSTLVSTSATHATVAGFGLRLVDDAGYYSPEFKRNRLGANTILLTKGFVPMATYISNTPDALHTINAVYAHGVPSDMLTQIPVQNSTDTNLAQGTVNFPTNNAPIASTTVFYTKWEIRVKPLVSNYAAGDSASRFYTTYDLWLRESGAGTDYANTVNAIAALTPTV